ncbi:MAG: hypothetical protein ABIK82_15475 [Pseudomonadota bacterium]
MKKNSESKPRKKYLRNSRMRKLDLKCLQTNRFGVVSSTDAAFPGHAVTLASAIQQLNQAGADLKRVCPQTAYGEVIIELPARCKLKLVVPATDQGSLDVARNPEHPVDAVTNEDQTSKDSDQVELSNHREPSLPIAESSLAEAQKIAECASKISMAAVDVGNQLVDQAEASSITLEDAVAKLAESPDEKVSRNSYGRSGGQAQTIRYSALGERTLGGNHIVAADALSTDTYSLAGCHLIQGRRNGGYILEGNSHDPEWIRLSLLQLGEIEVVDDKNTREMELLGYALTSNHTVDIDVCLAEKIRNKRRWLKPLAIHNRSEIIARTRDRLDLLEED